MQTRRNVGSITFNLAVFQAVLGSAEKLYSRGKAVMSLPTYIYFLRDPMVILGGALLGLWLLHRATTGTIMIDAEEDSTRDLFDPSGKRIRGPGTDAGTVVRRQFVYALAVFSLAIAVYVGWVLVSPRVPDKQTFDEWASEFHRVKLAGKEGPVLAAEGRAVTRMNAEVQPMYLRTVETIRGVLKAYRRNAPNTSIWLPAVPANVFGGEAAAYSGGVTISRDCSWSVRMDSPGPGMTRKGPVLIWELMNGDGTTKTGRSVGTISFVYDFDSECLRLSAIGLAGQLLSDTERSAPVNEIEALVCWFSVKWKAGALR